MSDSWKDIVVSDLNLEVKEDKIIPALRKVAQELTQIILDLEAFTIVGAYYGDPNMFTDAPDITSLRLVRDSINDKITDWERIQGHENVVPIESHPKFNE